MTEHRRSILSDQTGNVPEDPVFHGRALLRRLLEYQGTRRTVGEITLRNRVLRREARLMELEDGERLVILVLDDVLCYWAPTSEPLETLHRRARDWITEPAPPTA
jgi:hypothetical protein